MLHLLAACLHSLDECQHDCLQVLRQGAELFFDLLRREDVLRHQKLNGISLRCAAEQVVCGSAEIISKFAEHFIIWFTHSLFIVLVCVRADSERICCFFLCDFFLIAYCF